MLADWLRHSDSNLVEFTRVGSNPVAGTTNHKPTADSELHPSEVSKRVFRGNSESTSSNAASPHQLDSCPYTQSALTNKNKGKKQKCILI